MWAIMVELDGPQMTIRLMRFPCRATKATNTRLEYVILVAFPLQKWLFERASMLRYMYSAGLVFSKIVCSAVAVTNHFSPQQAQLMLSRYTVNTTPTTSPGQDVKN